MAANKTDLAALLKKLLNNGPHKILNTSRRVRILHHANYIVDTTSAVYVWEHPYYPHFWIPMADFSKHLSWKQLKQESSDDGSRSGEVCQITGRGANNEEWTCDRVIKVNGDALGAGSKDLVKVEFGAVDQWFEEDVSIIVHPKDPFKRVDLLPSTRHIRVTVPDPASPSQDITLAESGYAIHLFETMLPTRFYLPQTAMNQSLVTPSEHKTSCPYKGVAEYYNIVLPKSNEREEPHEFKNIVWYYRSPIVECATLVGLVCFYNEKCDIWIDGEKQERPKTHFA